MNEMTSRAKEIPWKERKDIICNMDEAKELIPALVKLFQFMEPKYPVIKTHGVSEYGKDIVIIKKDKMGETVIAVIVKRGKISGKTSGDTDDIKNKIKTIFSSKENKTLSEIKSQIEQADTIPADLPILYDKIKVNEVWIVLAGELSNNAKERLRNDVDQKIHYRDPFDIKWLVDKFTEYYPHVFFNMEINEFLDEKIKSFEKCSSLKNEDSLILSDVFVPPVLTKDCLPSISDEADLSAYFKKKFMKKEKMSFNTLEEVVKSNNVIIVGDPGTGKTSALHKIAIDDLRLSLSKNTVGNSDEIITPILIHSKDMISAKGIEDVKKTYYGKFYESLKHSKINKIIVDAIDEIEPFKRDDVIKKAVDFSKSLNTSLILSSRKVGCINCVPKEFQKYEILPLEFSQAMKLIKAYLRSDEEKMKVIEEKIREINLPILPLSLTLLVKVIKEFDEIPASITELYNRFFEVVLGRYDLEKGISAIFDYPAKRRILNTFAFEELLKKNRTSINGKEFEDFYNNYSKEYLPDSKYSFSDFLTDIERAGVINITNEKVCFSHKTFLEYLAANYIFDQQTEFEDINEMIADLYFNDLWGETAFFFCGMKKNISEKIFDRIFENNVNELPELINKFTSPRLLQAAYETRVSVKVSSILKASSFSSDFKKKFVELISSTDFKNDFLADVMILNFSIYSLSSNFLTAPVKEVIGILLNDDKIQNYYRAVYTLAGIEHKISPKEKTEIIKKIADAANDSIKIGLEDKSKVLLYLSKMEDDKDVSIKYATKKLNRIMRKHKELVRAISITKKTINRINKGYKNIK